MGGLGSGGHPAVGRKPQEREVYDDSPLPDVPMPAGLNEAEQSVWAELAPLALVERTLTPATAGRFKVLCHAVAMMQKYAAKLDEDGLTYMNVVVDGNGVQRENLKAHPLIGAHRGMMQRVEAGMTAFRLAPTGRALASRVKDKPKNALESLQNQIRAIK